MKNKPEIFNKASEGHLKTNGNEKKEEDKEDGYIVDKKGVFLLFNYIINYFQSLHSHIMQIK